MLSISTDSGLTRRYKYYTHCLYDEYGRSIGYNEVMSLSSGMITATFRYVYGDPTDPEQINDAMYEVKKGTGAGTPTTIISYEYDDFGRITQRNIHTANVRESYYTYKDISSTQTTTQVASVRNNYADNSYGDDCYYYKYDERGYISHIRIVYGNYVTDDIYYT